MDHHEFLEKTLAFLGSIGVVPKKPKFYVEVNFDSKGAPSSVYSSATDTVIRLAIREDEWRVYVNVPPQKESHVRVDANGPSVYGRDKLGILKHVTTINELPRLFREIEKGLGVKFPRVAFVRTNVAGAKKAVANWVATL